MKAQTILTDQELELRPISLSDCTNEYVRWLNDPQVNQFLETRFNTQTLSSVEAFIKEKMVSEHEYCFAMTVNSTHIGNIKLGPINHFHDCADVSLFIGNKDYWHKGLAKRAISLITDFAFQLPCINKLIAGAYEDNVSSVKAFKKVGYTVEAILPNRLKLNNQYTGLVMMGLTRSDYKQ